MIIVAVAVTAGLAVYVTSGARGLLVGSVDPATVQALRLRSAVSGQGVAVGGYAVSRDTRFLNGYKRAVTAETAALGTIERLLRDVPGSAATRAAAAEVGRASHAWRRDYAEPVIAAVPAHGAAALSPALARVQLQRSAAVEKALGALDTDLSAVHRRAAGRLTSGWAFLYAALALVAATLAGVTIALAVLVRGTVLRPVMQLTDQVRRVAGGDFAHPLEVAGPGELAELAAHVDAMRDRIVDEWQSASRARERMDAQAAELRRSNAELEQFAYVASHDLQEPLRKVASFCQMLEQRYGDVIDERGRQYIKFAVDGATRMQRLINDLLSFSRVGRFASQVVSTQSVFAAALDNLSEVRAETGAEITAGPLPEVIGDPVLLTQVFQNLIGNAIKFRGADPPRVRIEARPDGSNWQFSCTDNGIGIQPQHAERIFLIFQRLHPKEEYTGTGIGLALCKKIIEHHGGRIWLDAALPEGAAGTVIHWTLPAVHATDESGNHDDE